MMFNCSRKWQKGFAKDSKCTNEEDIDKVGILDEVVIVQSSGSIQHPTESLPPATLSPCYFCQTIGKHRAEVNKIVENGNGAIIETSFRDIPLCNIKTPIGEKSMTLNDIEEMYTKNFPLWEEDFQCFPEGPIFYDKLFKKEPFTRAIDIEKKMNQLRNKIQSISKVPFDAKYDSDNVMITKTVNSVLDSLRDVIRCLNLENNLRVNKNIPSILSGMVRGKLKELKDASQSIAAIQEIQDKIFEKVLENDNKCREEKGYYNMR